MRADAGRHAYADRFADWPTLQPGRTPTHRKDVPVDACCWGGHAPCKACASGQVRGTHCAELEVAR